MKKILRSVLSISLVLSLVTGLMACSQTNTQESNTEQATSTVNLDAYKIGVNLELTGSASVWGLPQKNAIEMYVKQLNENGGINGIPIELVIYDNESNETQSLVVSKKLVEQDQVLAVIGGGTTPTTMASIPYMNKQGVPLVSVGSGDEIVLPVEERKWIFKTPSNNQDISVKIAEFLQNQEKKDIAFIALNNAYGDSGLSVFREVAADYDINIVSVEKVGLGDKDAKPQLTRIKSENPDAILVWAIPPAASIINRNYWELNMHNMLVFSAGAGANAFIELAGKEAAEETYIASGKVWVIDQLSDDDPQKTFIKNYVSNYESLYNDGVSPIDGMAYDAIHLIVKAIELSGDEVSRESIRNNLEKIQDLVGITGVFNLSPDNHQGLTPKDVEILQVQNGEWTLVK